MRTAVERIHPVAILETDSPEHLLDALGLRADLTHDAPRLGVEQRHVDGIARKQIADEVLVLAREEIRLCVAHVREAPPDGFPEVARPVWLEGREQLGQELVTEERAPRRDE